MSIDFEFFRNPGSHCLCGKIGSGKTLTATSIILDELEHGTRHVITNCPIFPGRIADYFLEKGVKWDPSRLIILDSEDPNQGRIWYRIRPFGTKNLSEYAKNLVVIPELSKQKSSEGKTPDYSSKSSKDKGVLYVIDEVHRYLNARNWSNVGAHILDYMSLVRHFGDSVVWITQSIKNVDSQFRSISTDYSYLQNYNKRKFKTYFRSLGYFELKTYPEPYYRGLEPDQTFKFKLDKKKAACYSTSIFGGNADKGIKVKGLSLNWIWASIFLFLVALPVVLYCGADFMAKKSISSATVGFEEHHASDLPPNDGFFSTKTVIEEKKDLEYFALPLKNLSAAQMAAKLKGFFGSELRVSAAYHKVVGQASSSQIPMIKKFVLDTDFVPTNVEVSVEFLQAAMRNSDRFDLSFLAKYSAGISSDVFASLSFFDGIFSAKGSIGFLDILAECANSTSDMEFWSRQESVILDGEEVTISYGSQYPIVTTQSQNGNLSKSVSYKDIVFSLKVAPEVLPSGNQVRLKIVQNNDNVESLLKVNGSQVPVVSVQTNNSNILVNSGDTVIAGSFKLRFDQKSVSRPNIPILKSLLKTSQKTHKEVRLFVLVTVKIL